MEHVSKDFWSRMPRDPFEGDPDDPASLLDPVDSVEEFPPLSEEERVEVSEDLTAVRAFRAAMAPDGFLGVCMTCDDCQEMHFYTWDVLEGHYLTLLQGKESPVHEPEYAPDVERYVPWEYCAGYTDAKMRGRTSRWPF